MPQSQDIAIDAMAEVSKSTNPKKLFQESLSFYQGRPNGREGGFRWNRNVKYKRTINKGRINELLQTWELLAKDQELLSLVQGYQTPLLT